MSRNLMFTMLSCMALAACSAPADEDELVADSVKKVCENPSFVPAIDPGYRVQIYPTADNGGQHAMPSPSSNWTLKYEYTVPPLPCSSTWNPADETYYIWGDVDFDVYGAQGQYPLSRYAYNQIVPQLMIGNALSGNDAAYAPSWNAFSTWVIQAQYFWHDADGANYAQTGKAVGVSPGDLVTTSIKYTASTGAIAVTISTSKVSSSITIARPFPNESPALFTSWKDFFQKGAAQSSTLWARPIMNVESHFVDESTVCAALPWKVELFSEPGTPAKGASFTVAPYAGLTCPKGSYATLSF